MLIKNVYLNKILLKIPMIKRIQSPILMLMACNALGSVTSPVLVPGSKHYDMKSANDSVEAKYLVN